MPDTHDAGPLLAQTIRVRTDAPLVHRGVTREIEEPYRVGSSIIIRLPFNRSGRWVGILTSWLPIRVKLPIGPKLDYARAIVIGWWSQPHLDEWQALLKALGQEPDGDDEREFTDPEFHGTHEDRGISIIGRRRMDDPDDVRADG